MSRALVILDFDRTLFNPDFYSEFIQLLARHGLPSEVAGNIVSSLSDTNQSIDLFHEIQAAGFSEKRARDLAGNDLGHDKFLYPDVVPFLERNSLARIVILTTAEGEKWQEFKLSLCPALSRFKRIIISGSKGTHILDHLKREDSLLGLSDLPYEMFSSLSLVDDRVEPIKELIGQPGINLWHIERPDSKYKGGADSPQVNEISSLTEVQIS